MKAVLYKVLLIFIVPIVFTRCEKEPDPITIPDDNFLNALIELGVDTNGDGIISPAEAAIITYLNVSAKNISDLTGIEAFINLDTLLCVGNQLTSLDVSKNTALEMLYCAINQLTGLDVSKNTALDRLYCATNQLTSLDVSKNTLLTSLDCEDNQLTSLDVSKNTALEWLFCYNNQLTSLDVSNNITLRGLKCYNNQLTSLDVSSNTRLTWLYCGENQLTSLDVSNNTALVTLGLFSMPTLYEVCVWKMPFPPAGVTVDTIGSPNVYFTTECTG